MNTKILMRVTVLYLGLIGLGLTFLPQEIAVFFNEEKNHTIILTLQILGSLYLGFAMMNWMSKDSLIGGIYNRPIVFGNLLHFLISAFALVKTVGIYSNQQFNIILMITVVYALFTLCFGYVLSTSPVQPQDDN